MQKHTTIQQTTKHTSNNNNGSNVPWGLHHFPLPGAPDGFPVWLDINLSERGAQTWLTWLREALLLDGATRGLEASLVTYNADLRVFALTTVSFEFGDGGSIRASHDVKPIRMEAYDLTGPDASPADAARLAAEAALSAACALMALAQLRDVARAARSGGAAGLRRYFGSAAHWVDGASNALLLACVALWWTFVVGHAGRWSVALRYDVYADLEPRANFLRLSAAGRGLSAAWGAVRALREAVGVASWYFALSGINVLLLLAR